MSKRAALVFALALTAQTPKERFEAGAVALRDGDLRKAESEFLAVSQAEPRNPGALGNLGVVYSRLGALEKAASAYERALKLLPSDPALKTNLALIYLRQQRHADTAALLHSVMTPKARELYATALLHTGATAEAERILEALPRNNGVLYALALAQLKNGKRELAAASFEQLDLAPDQLHFAKGKAFYESALFEDALSEFERIQSTLPGLALERGKTHVSLRNAERAEADLRAAIAETPLDSEANYFLGALLVQGGRETEGLTFLSRANEDFWGTHYYRGRGLLAANRPAEAVAALEHARALQPTQSRIDFQLSRAYAAVGQPARSRAAAARYRETKASEREALVLRD